MAYETIKIDDFDSESSGRISWGTVMFSKRFYGIVFALIALSAVVSAAPPATSAPASQPSKPRVGLGVVAAEVGTLRESVGKEADIIGIPQKGIIIQKLIPNGSASAMGLQELDVITRIDGEPVYTAENLADWADNATVGKRYRIVYYRQPDLKSKYVEHTSYFAAKERNDKATEALLQVRPIGVAVVDKGYKPLDVNTMRDDDYNSILIKYTIQNNSGKPLRATKGTLVVSDLFGDKIASIGMKFTPSKANKTMEDGGTETVTYFTKYNQFNDSDVKLKNTDLADLKFKFVTETIIYADGSTEDFDSSGEAK